MLQEKNNEMAFRFTATSQEIRSLLIENEPYFIAKDVCDILALTNSRKAISTLDNDEKADVTISYTSSNGVVQNRKVKAINESGLYALILRSNKPEAKVFRKWITSEVLPSIRKNGFYSSMKRKNDFIEARDIPYTMHVINDYGVRCIFLNERQYFSVNDVHRAINSSTSANQAAKQLNKLQKLAHKIWIFGNTNPSWFTTAVGVQLLLSGSRILQDTRITQLSLFSAGGSHE